MSDEIWAKIADFPFYEVSNFGRICNVRTGNIMKVSRTLQGHLKITLLSEDGFRYTRSVPQIVAEAFVSPPTPRCDSVVLLDGNLENVAADNIVWRPRWFGWKYARQLQTLINEKWVYAVPVINNKTGELFNSIMDVSMREGLLFQDVWSSTYTGNLVFPVNASFSLL